MPNDNVPATPDTETDAVAVTVTEPTALVELTPVTETSALACIDGEPIALVDDIPDGAAEYATSQALPPQTPLPQPIPVKNSSSIVTEPIAVEELTPEGVSILPNAILLEPTADVVDKLATVMDQQQYLPLECQLMLC